MPVQGFKTITVDDDTYQQIDKIRELNKMKTMPETVRAMVRKINGTDVEWGNMTPDSMTFLAVT